MSTIPFEKQRLPEVPVEQIERKIAQGNAISGDELLQAIEQSAGHQLDDRLRDVARKFAISAVKRRGRPSNCKGQEDFAMAELDAGYPALLRQHEDEAQQRQHLAAAKGTALPEAEPTPSELAYTQILKEMKADFPNMDWRSLANKHSAWKNGHFHSSENHVGSEDFEAEIDRLFPTPRRS
jgi:hypothetical protein